MMRHNAFKRNGHTLPLPNVDLTDSPRYVPEVSQKSPSVTISARGGTFPRSKPMTVTQRGEGIYLLVFYYHFFLL